MVQHYRLALLHRPYTISCSKSKKITKQLKNFSNIPSLLWKLLDTSQISTRKSLSLSPYILHMDATHCIQFSFLIIIFPNKFGEILAPRYHAKFENTFLVDYTKHKYLVLQENFNKKTYFYKWKVLSYLSKWKNSKTW